MISFPKRERAQHAAACVGVDAGKFSHTLVVRPQGRARLQAVQLPDHPCWVRDARWRFIRQQGAERRA